MRAAEEPTTRAALVVEGAAREPASADRALDPAAGRVGRDDEVSPSEAGGVSRDVASSPPRLTVAPAWPRTGAETAITVSRSRA